MEENQNELESRLAMLFNENTKLKSLIEESHQTIQQLKETEYKLMEKVQKSNQEQNQKIIELERVFLIIVIFIFF